MALCSRKVLLEPEQSTLTFPQGLEGGGGLHQINSLKMLVLMFNIIHMLSWLLVSIHVTIVTTLSRAQGAYGGRHSNKDHF